MRWVAFAVFAVVAGSVRDSTGADEHHPHDPMKMFFSAYERHKNGPPLTNVFHKARPEWIFAKLKNPRSHKNARMAVMELSEDEIRPIMAYLWSIRDKEFATFEWPKWAVKSFDDMTEAEEAQAAAAISDGKKVWSRAGCVICHAVQGPGDDLVGGLVDLRVGGIDLVEAGVKLKRDWVYAWLKDPRSYFPDTFMPRFRLSDKDRRALVEYLLRGPDTTPMEDVRAWGAEELAFLGDDALQSRGKALITKVRCIVCHDIKGVEEILPALKPQRIVTLEQVRKLSGDASCSTCHQFAELARDVKCLSCHSISGRGGWYAPDLTTEGSRIHGEWIEEFVQNPNLVRPLLQQMPRFELSAAEAKIIREFAEKFLVGDSIQKEFERGDPANGRALFESKGCVSCHKVPASPGGLLGPGLGEAGVRLRPGYILAHIRNPHLTNPYSMEPRFKLTDQEARDLATFLSGLK